MADAVLELSGIRRAFGTRVVTEVLRGIDLRIETGEFLALVGPSGSGKSTLLNQMGLLDRPTSGRVIVEGVDVTTMDDDALTRVRGRTLGFVFQFHHLLRAFSAAENVMMPMAVDQGRFTPAMRARAEELLRRVGLEGRGGQKASEMSGGQQQRVAIARALAGGPGLVLADEPTGNLDTASADQVFSLMRDVNAETGTAFVIVTHSPELARRCDRVVTLVDGRIERDERSGEAAAERDRGRSG